MYMPETQGGISEPPAPPYPVGMAEERREAVGHIYDRVAGKEPPKHNIASRALRAYYTRVDPPDPKHLGMPDSLHDCRVPHGLRDPRFHGHQSDTAEGTCRASPSSG